MAAGKTTQSNTSLVALVIFIILFLICAVLAVLMYTKYEDQKILTSAAEDNLARLASRSEQNMLDSKLVGKPIAKKTYIATMSEYLDEMITTVTGELPEANAATKINDTKIAINNAITSLGTDATAIVGKEGFDLLNTITDLKKKLDSERKKVQDGIASADKLQETIDRNLKQYRAEKLQLEEAKVTALASQRVLAEKYNELKALADQTTTEQIQNWKEKLDTAVELQNNQTEQIATLNEKVKQTETELNEALTKLSLMKSIPDNLTAAVASDATVFTADLQRKVIYLNIGSKDHVYPGLTFSIFDPRSPIDEDTKPKAEVEVFRVNESSCAAKILSSSKRDSIIQNDVAVNMGWSGKSNCSFMIIGDFDFDGDGITDRNGIEKAQQLIARWGGRVMDDLTVETDFIIVGKEPKEVKRPSQAKIDNDPEVEVKYTKSVERVKQYKELLDKAKQYSVPVFNRKRFMQLTGYETSSRKSTPVAMP